MFEVKHTNAYLYSQLTYPKNIEWTLGLSVDALEDEETTVERDQFNPKIGLVFRPTKRTTFRAATFRTLTRPLAAQQTIEPTQVSGFNQFYDDDVGTKAWRYGASLDQTFSEKIYGGVEYSIRELETPLLDGITGEVDYFNWQEDVLRAYLFWTPHPWWAVRAEYLFERFERDDGYTGVENIRELDTHRFPFGISFFHPSGLSFNTKLSWVDQKGIFGPTPAEFQQGEDQFWLFDAAIQYKCPKRFGTISIGVKNITDEEFSYQDMDLSRIDIYPERVVYGKISFSF